ncbi:gliding motility-associated C-terminal domain-containing protein [Hymenobacter sp. UYCo722]|uniref:T9SS type B sorting domain-containing protein n=1 Tax=Hymenobacter sp. UYCo722 TaxID=3156335 RepID=UPI00339B6711
MGMLKIPFRQRFIIATLMLLLVSRPGFAQKEFDNWYFGNQAGISFSTGAARSLTNGVMKSGEGSAAISDAQGNLLFYTNGVYAWNRQHRRMVNGSDLGAYKDSTRTDLIPNSATQGVVVVPRPNSTTEYFIFTVDAAENNLADGLRYSVVDMSLQGGLGQLVSKNNPVSVPVGDGRLTEKLLAVRHANQRDIWIIVHAWNSNVFISYLLTAQGLSTKPVLSSGGTVHQGGNNIRHNYNAIGWLKVSRDGRKLAMAQYNSDVELFDFNYGTGVVSGSRVLPKPLMWEGAYGVEFSPDGNLLYASIGNNIIQYRLGKGIEAQLLNGVSAGALQLGSDDKIYVARWGDRFQGTSVGVIDFPDAPGTACGYRPNGIQWPGSGQGSFLGLPNVMARPPVPGSLLFNFSISNTNICQGETAFFAASVFPVIPDATFTWDFGDPTHPNNTALGATAQHRYLTSGTYTVTLNMRQVSGVISTYSQTLSIVPRPIGHLVASSFNNCSGTIALLTFTPAPDVSAVYRWQNGSTSREFNATTSGLYWVEVTTGQQCTIRDSIRISFYPKPIAALQPEIKYCADQNLVLDPGPQPIGTTYRWQDGSTAPQLTVGSAGRYSVIVTGPGGCSSSASTRVAFSDGCPYVIPNIITPNNDGYNDAFVLKGLEYQAWNIQIYNRWGVLVFQKEHYDNLWAANGLPVGIYFYQLTQAATGRQLKGWVEVNR